VANITDYLIKITYTMAINSTKPNVKELAIKVIALDLLAKIGLEIT
jgi:hypothetical protein